MKKMKMRNAYPLLIAFLLATPHMYAMEIETDELLQPEIVTKCNTESLVYVLGYAPDGKYLATEHKNEQVQIRSTDGTVKTKWDSGSWVLALGYAPDGNYLATGHENGQVQICNILPVLAAHACQKKGLTLRQWYFLKKLKKNKTNNPLYLNADGQKTFKSLCETDEDGEKKPGIDDFYTLYKLKANDAEPDESKKRWRILPKVCNQKGLEKEHEELQEKDEDA